MIIGNKPSLVLLLALLVMCSASTQALTVKKTRSHSKETALRVVLEMDAKPKFRYELNQHAMEFVLDIQNAKMAEDAALHLVKGPLIASVQPKPKTDVLSLVFSLRDKVIPKVFHLPPLGKSGHRLIVDLKQFDSSPNQNNLTAQHNTIVVIDAGHGGHDSGALGARRRGPRTTPACPEKCVTLDIGKRLKKILDRYRGIESVLIRKQDVFISLPDRIKTAREIQADMFVSIHADAHKNSKAKGASVFIRPENMATKTQTLDWLVDQEGNSGHTQAHHPPDGEVKDVLADMLTQASLSSSIDLAETMLTYLGRIGSLHGTHARRGNFHVLRTPDIPSILIETGFISNPDEAKKLRTGAYRQQLAEQIALGLVHFIRQQTKSPAGWLPGRQSIGEYSYQIGRGDTLLGLAQRFNVSVQAIMHYNGLERPNLIRAGDTLIIP